MKTEEIVAALGRCCLARISRETGIHRNTLSKIRNGGTRKLSAGTRSLIEGWLKA